MHVHTFTDATGFQRVTNSPHDCDTCHEPYKNRPIARQARTVHYGGAPRGPDAAVTDADVIRANIANTRENMKRGTLTGTDVALDDLECLLGVVEQHLAQP